VSWVVEANLDSSSHFSGLGILLQHHNIMARAKSHPAAVSSVPNSEELRTQIPSAPVDGSTPDLKGTQLNKGLGALSLHPVFVDSSAIDMDMPKKMMCDALRTKLAEEEAALEDMIVDLIVDEQWEILLPNSGRSVVLGDRKSVSVFYNEDSGSAYRTWEWHGHVMVYEDGEGYVPEYIYGNYFEPLENEDEYEPISMSPVVGLGGIISGVERRAPSKAL
jgi:hypothetical protein